MSKFAIKANALGDGDLTLEIPEMAVDQTLEFPPEGGRLARADAADGMPLMSDGTPVVESGSNSDGAWSRFADGTQICVTRTSGTTGGWSASGSLYRTSFSRTWTFPAVFSTSSDLSADGGLSDGGGVAGSVFGVKFASPGVTSASYEYWATTNPGSVAAATSLHATGRWK